MDKKYDSISGEWFLKGDNDIKNAQILFDHGGSNEGVCFLAQQGAEKYLKGFLVFNNRIYRLTHDLYTTLKDCGEIDEDFLGLGEKCKFLTAYYIESRYPVGIDEFTRDEAEEALGAAYFVIGFVNKKIEDEEKEK